VVISGRRLGLKPILGALSLLVLAACAGTRLEGPAGPNAAPPPPPPPPPVSAGIFIAAPFRADDFAWSVKPGTARIQGLTAQGASCSGKTVALTPVTPYSRERIHALYGSETYAIVPMDVVRAKTIANDNPAMRGYVRAAHCGPDGAFLFEKLPAGPYFIIAEVEDPTGAKVIMRHVDAVAGRTLQAPLNGAAPAPPARRRPSTN
jgi:hypothetical protein